jgi:hypothetical protein
MLNKFRLCQRALGSQYIGERTLIDTVARACRGSPELDRAMEKPLDTFEGLCSNLRASLAHYTSRQNHTYHTQSSVQHPPSYLPDLHCCGRPRLGTDLSGSSVDIAGLDGRLRTDQSPTYARTDQPVSFHQIPDCIKFQIAVSISLSIRLITRPSHRDPPKALETGSRSRAPC